MKTMAVDWDSSHVVYEPGSFSGCENSMKLFVVLHTYVHTVCSYVEWFSLCLLVVCMHAGRKSVERG